MDPVDCSGQTHRGRQVIHSSTNHNERSTLCCNSYLAPSTVKSLDEFSKTQAFEKLVLLNIPAVRLAKYCVSVHFVALLTAMAFAEQRDARCKSDVKRIWHTSRVQELGFSVKYTCLLSLTDGWILRLTLRCK